ncbi:MAG: hypothetical protein ACRC8Z_10775 [Empedobacter falsenii]
MELQKLLEFVWKLIEDGTLDGNEVPDLDYCQTELQTLKEWYAENKLIEEMGYLPRRKPKNNNYDSNI